MRKILAATVLLAGWSGIAAAQPIPPPVRVGTTTGTVAAGNDTRITGALSTAGGTVTGVVNLNGGVNTISPAGYLVNGLTGIALSVGPIGQYSVFLGPGAGQNIINNGLQTGFGGVAIGVFSGQSLTVGSGGEFAFGGAYAGQYYTSGYAATAWGEHVIGYDNCSYCTAIGNDSMRDTIGENNSTAVGAQSQDDGVGNNNTALGAFSLLGNSGSVLITGSVTTGDRNCIPFTSTNSAVAGLPASACYTTIVGDSLSSVAAGLGNAMSALNVFTPGGGPSPGNGVQMAGDAHGTPGGTQVLRFHFPGGNTTGWAIQPGTPTCSGGTCTEVLTVQAPFSGTSNVGVGVNAVSAYGQTSGIGLVGVGDSSLSNLIGAGNSNTVCVGLLCGSALKATSSSILIGANVLSTAGGHSGYTSVNDVMVLTNASIPATYTGNSNTLINSASAVTGSATGNVAIGWNVTLPSSSNNWQLNIQNALYGAGNNKGGGGGYGWLGSYCTGGNGNASFTLCDAGGSNTTYGAHLGILQTTAPTITSGTATLDATASDVAGRVTEGTLQTGFTLAFNVAFKTAPHCVVSSPNGSVMTGYTSTTTSLAVTNASATGDIFTYICVQ